jgi:hypothetical protein
MADIPDISPRTVLLRYNLRVGDNTPEIGVVSSAIWGPDASFLRATRGPFPKQSTLAGQIRPLLFDLFEDRRVRTRLFAVVS